MNRWWIPVISAGLIGLLVWGGNIAVDARRFPIQSVKVEGTLRNLSATQLQDTVNDFMNESFFRVNLDGIRKAVMALPWVKSASVRREWPDSIKLVVRERSVAALWGDRALVDLHGEVFRPVRRPDVQGLPLLEGPADTAPLMLEQYHRVSAWLAPLGDRVQRLVMDSRRAWRLELQGGTWILLGRDALPERLGRYVRAIGAIRRQHPAQVTSRVDLRYPNGLAIQWADSPVMGGE